MGKYRLTQLAQNDFDDIGSYTLSEWGLLQAEKYQTQLDTCFQKIANDTGYGRKRHDLSPHIFCYPCNKHMIFFRRDASGSVDILRILHERMDFDVYF